MTLGEKIKLLRTEREMTQPALAEKAGIEQSYLSKLENGKGSPSYDIINRIAVALGTTAMDLIGSLSQSYIEDHLAHIPEVAAEYESIRLRREFAQKKRFLAASMAVIVGTGLFLCGVTGIFFPERTYDYRSPGVIFTGESDNLFDFAFPVPPGTNFADFNEKQADAIENRMDVDFLVSFDYLGKSFTRQVPGGKRIYTEYSTRGLNRRENDIMSTLGLMFIFTGILGFVYSLRFKPH